MTFRRRRGGSWRFAIPPCSARNVLTNSVFNPQSPRTRLGRVAEGRKQIMSFWLSVRVRRGKVCKSSFLSYWLQELCPRNQSGRDKTVSGIFQEYAERLRNECGFTKFGFRVLQVRILSAPYSGRQVSSVTNRSDPWRLRGNRKQGRIQDCEIEGAQKMYSAHMSGEERDPFNSVGDRAPSKVKGTGRSIQCFSCSLMLFEAYFEEFW